MKEQETIITVLTGQEVAQYISCLITFNERFNIIRTPKKYIVCYNKGQTKATNNLTRVLRELINNEPNIIDLTILNMESYKKMYNNELNLY